MAIETAEATRLEIRRILKAPVASVYAAWTDPQQVSQWMAPGDDFGPTEATADVRVGGSYRIVMRGPDGELHRVGGVYQEVVPNRRLVYSWAWESTPERVSRVTVEFRPSSGESTELVLTHDRFFDTEARDKHGHGWQGCLGRFERYLSR
jgi:uncharacterized protein YndB with AHSA1/START domain